jgi:hypothetical protein
VVLVAVQAELGLMEVAQVVMLQPQALVLLLHFPAHL